MVAQSWGPLWHSFSLSTPGMRGHLGGLQASRTIPARSQLGTGLGCPETPWRGWGLQVRPSGPSVSFQPQRLRSRLLPWEDLRSSSKYFTSSLLITRQ